MKRISRTAPLAALALTLALGLSACGDDDSSESTTPQETMTTTPSPSATDAATEDATSGSSPFGPACASLPESGDGSAAKMATQPVATAAAGNPLLTTLATAVEAAGLVDTLNDAEALTVFAPTNDAFAKIPADDLKALLADKEALTKVLTHHVVGAAADRDAVVAEHETLNMDTVKVTASGDDYEVDGAAVLCGDVDTKNAKVYVIDTVLMP
ncbi:fasciclin domain-containing protein [Nocardioides yefusunii]|uniref:Fasciclin domain-containing protein n=1 Tax=Nocardioides yefusunii TaxID=2500546 RepID=A0ABW1R0F7_9ACTN|nr:fasciclin domain-containing protein [Nocardioides yefusunii]